jgi:hypothetical protein
MHLFAVIFLPAICMVKTRFFSENFDSVVPAQLGLSSQGHSHTRLLLTSTKRISLGAGQALVSPTQPTTHCRALRASLKHVMGAYASLDPPIA